MDALDIIKEAKKSYLESVAQHGKAALLAAYTEACRIFDTDVMYAEYYTPYFNDGDPCVYRLHALSALKKGVDKFTIDLSEEINAYGDEEWESIYYWRETDVDTEKQAIYTVITELLLEIAAEVFGDNVKVLFRDGKFTIASYEDHD